MLISALEGVKVKIMVAWVGVQEVSRNNIRVHARAISRSFPVEDFFDIPRC
jgi:hypothetical protein